MYATLEHSLSYKFSNISLLELALTHTSASSNKKSYERMEFLGDRVLSLVVAELLYTIFPEEEEGALAKRHSALVKQQTLVKLAHSIELENYIHVATRDTKITESILSDVLEALFAAIYLDSDFNKARIVVKKLIEPIIHETDLPPIDIKSALQEWAQGRSLSLPEYIITDREGPDHMPIFTVQVRLADYPVFSGNGASKQAAEKNAAQFLLDFLKENHHD